MNSEILDNLRMNFYRQVKTYNGPDSEGPVIGISASDTYLEERVHCLVKIDCDCIYLTNEQLQQLICALRDYQHGGNAPKIVRADTVLRYLEQCDPDILAGDESENDEDEKEPEYFSIRAQPFNELESYCSQS